MKSRFSISSDDGRSEFYDDGKASCRSNKEKNRLALRYVTLGRYFFSVPLTVVDGSNNGRHNNNTTHIIIIIIVIPGGAAAASRAIVKILFPFVSHTAVIIRSHVDDK